MPIIIGIALLVYFLVKKQIINEKFSNSKISKTENKKTLSDFDSSTKPMIQKESPLPGRSQKTIKDEYFHLTGVDIEAEKHKWDERGKGYYGEYKVFEKLFFGVPGGCKFLMNLEVPTKFGKTTEIDLLMVHETGIYIFEVKHFKGTIYGKSGDKTWTQYFRTTNNYSFGNPICQNDYHIEAMVNELRKTDFLSVQKENLHSVVVFTNDEVDLRVENLRKDVLVIEVNNLIPSMNKMLNEKTIWSVDEIDCIWRYFSKFAPICSDNMLTDDSGSVSLIQYIDALKISYEKQEEKVSRALAEWKNELTKMTEQYNRELISVKKRLEKEHKKQSEILKKKSMILTLITIVFCVLVLIVTVIFGLI